MDTVKPQLIIINQTLNPTFNRWVSELITTHGPVELWTGDKSSILAPNVIIRRGPTYIRSSTIARIRTWGLFTLVVTLWLLQKGGKTPIFVATNPPFMPLVAWLLYKVQKRPYALLEWDIYPQILAPMGLAQEGNFIYRLWYSWHRQALRRANLVVTIGDTMAAVLAKMASSNQLPLAVVPNWVNTNWIQPQPRPENPFVQEQGLQDKLVVLYSGNLGATHAIETILEVAADLRTETRICFLLIGEGSKRSLVENALADNRLPNLRLLPRQPESMLPYTLTSAHIGIVTLGNGYEQLSMPSKTYTLMAAGNAILGISQAPNDLASTLERHKCGANFSSQSVPAIVSWIQALANDVQSLEKMQQAARQAALNYYSDDQCATQLTKLIDQYLLSSDNKQSPS